MGTKRSVLTEGHGLPIAVVVSGANVHDVKLLSKTLDNLVVFRPLPTEEAAQNLCLDAGYTGHEQEVIQRNYIPHIRPRGEEKLELERNPAFKARRWVVEVTHSFVNRFRKLLVRFEKLDNSYLGLLAFAFAIIVWRNLIPVHQGMSILG
jgi:putative transposase